MNTCKLLRMEMVWHRGLKLLLPRLGSVHKDDWGTCVCVQRTDDSSVDWLGWAPAKKILRLRKGLYPLVNSGECAPAGAQGASDVVFKKICLATRWRKEILEDKWRTGKGKKQQAHHSVVRKSFFHLILDFQGLRCKLFMQLHPMLKLVIHNLQRLTSKQSSI